MNIQNIQIAQDLFRRVEEKFNSRKENTSPENNIFPSQGNTSEAKDATDGSLAASAEEDLMQVVYPPFFPVGNTQGILSIEGINLTGEEQKANRQKETGAKMENAEIKVISQSHTAPDMDNSIEKIKNGSNPGDVLDLKV